MYALPKLGYEYSALKPFMSEEQLRIHHEKHHQAYVNGANATLEKLEKTRKEGSEVDIKSALKTLSWNISGHKLHSLFWQNLSSKTGKLSAELETAIKKDFGSYERFKKEFTEAAASIEGSGWQCLIYEKELGKLMLMQVEKHNMNTIPGEVLLVLDMFEHAYYIDYKNDKAKYIENFWKIVNWDALNKRFEHALK
ncbi:MAG: superoxide dismutase [Candidatus Woesearchaeota archaeon]